jgi:hypothetical protein
LDLPTELTDKPGPKTPKRSEASPADSSDFDLAAHPEAAEGSSEFDLSPGGEGTVLMEDSNDFSLEASDDVLEAEKTELTNSSSGLNLDNPVDAGISLEGAGEESGDFDLSLEPEPTPRPQASRPVEESESSEFELTLDEKTPRPRKKPSTGESSDDIDLSLAAEDELDAKKEDDSEFEINLEGSDEVKAISSDSDSEFELTLDDSGNLAAMDEEAPQVKSKKGAPSAEEQDIFDTDFEVPALDESDEATVADSELESSDFDIALDDSDLAAEEESGSQVVALDEEEAGAAGDEDAAVADDVEVEEESSEFSDLDQDVEVEEEDVEVEAEARTIVKTKTVVKEKLIQPAPWGVMPVLFMFPCVIVMFLVVLLGFDLLQSSIGGRPPGPLTTAISESVFSTPVSLKK